MKLEQEIKQLEDYIKQTDMINTSVSSKSVGWHIDHSLKVIISICQTLHKSDPANYQWTLNLKRSFFLFIGVFPRGKAKAPKAVMATEEITLKDIKDQLQTAKSLLSSLDQLPENCFFIHPLFGQINRPQTPTFLKMHTYHHIKIIRDILK